MEESLPRIVARNYTHLLEESEGLIGRDSGEAKGTGADMVQSKILRRCVLLCRLGDVQAIDILSPCG